MDPLTGFVIATLMMLLNGGVLGLMHRDLPEALRPSAVSWRIGTLLQAGGCILLAVHNYLPPAFVLPLGNGMIMLGMTGYWRALRQFYGLPDTVWLLLPMLFGTLGIYWYAAQQPNLPIRVLIASLVWVVILIGATLTLRQPGQRDAAMSRRVLAGLFITLAVFMVLRTVYFLSFPAPAGSVLDRSSWMNMITPLIAAILPVIGTTAFLLLVSERIRRQWERAASTDYLTGLANRRTIANWGDQRMQAARRLGQGLSVALIDIDHFKSVNDRFGHDIGDAALKHVAARIESACRAQDLPGRQGGEEFVAVFDQLDQSQALAAGERLRLAVQAAPFATEALSLPITVSVGMATLSPNDRIFDDLLRRADLALYAAKGNGRNRVELAN